MEKFTASEVRSQSCKQGQLHRQPASDMLNGYADLLEAQEREGTVRQFRVAPKGWVWTDAKDDAIWAIVAGHPESYETRILYTRPDQAQPCSGQSCPDCEAEHGCKRSAQAQPPAASVTDAITIAAEISTQPEFSRYEAPFILDLVKAVLAAQENHNG